MFFKLKYGILRFLSFIICLMSYSHILAVGRFLGPVVMHRIAKQRKRGIMQIMSGMGKTEAEAERLLQAVYEHIGMSVMEMLYIPRLCDEKEHIGDYIVIDRPDILAKAYGEGQGIIGLTAHMGNWEWLGAGLALYGYPTSAIGKKQSDDALMKMINLYRAQAGQNIFLTGTGGYELIAAARAMKKNDILGFLSDKDGGTGGVPVKFMNRVFSFPQGPLVFARKFKAPIVPIFIVRNETAPGHTICVGDIFYYEETGDERGDVLRNAQKMASIIENFIKTHPSDWLWFQHLFWTDADSIDMYASLEKDEKAHLFQYSSKGGEESE